MRRAITLFSNFYKPIPCNLMKTILRRGRGDSRWLAARTARESHLSKEITSNGTLKRFSDLHSHFITIFLGMQYGMPPLRLVDEATAFFATAFGHGFAQCGIAEVREELERSFGVELLSHEE